MIGKKKEILFEQLTDDQQRDILDLEAQIIDLRRSLLDIEDAEEKEGVNQQIADLRDDIQGIKDSAD